MRVSDLSIGVRSTVSAESFRDGAARLVMRQPIPHSVLATTLDHAIETPRAYAGARWYWATRGDRNWLALAMHTPPRPFHLATADPFLARQFAFRLHRQDVELDAVSGVVKGALAFAETWTDLRGHGSITVDKREGMHDLPGIPMKPKGVRGHLRPAHDDDLELLNHWAVGYAREQREPTPGPDPMRRWLAKGGLYVWEADGEPATMTYASRPHGGVSRLSWVYTPDSLRGNGFASACVAGVSAIQRHAGRRCLLYTDLDNTPSTKLYQRIGYRRLADSAVLRMVP